MSWEGLNLWLEGLSQWLEGLNMETSRALIYSFA